MWGSNYRFREFLKGIFNDDKYVNLFVDDDTVILYLSALVTTIAQ